MLSQYLCYFWTSVKLFFKIARTQSISFYGKDLDLARPQCNKVSFRSAFYLSFTFPKTKVKTLLTTQKHRLVRYSLKITKKKGSKYNLQ